MIPFSARQASLVTLLELAFTQFHEFSPAKQFRTTATSTKHRHKFKSPEVKDLRSHLEGGFLIKTKTN